MSGLTCSQFEPKALALHHSACYISLIPLMWDYTHAQTLSFKKECLKILASTAKCNICSVTNLAAVVQALCGCVSSYPLQVGEHHSDGMRLSVHLHL